MEEKFLVFAKSHFVWTTVTVILFVAGVSYFGVNQYLTNQEQNIEKEKLAQEIQKLQMEKQLADERNNSEWEIQRLQQEKSDLLAQISSVASSSNRQSTKKAADTTVKVVSPVAQPSQTSSACAKFKNEYFFLKQGLMDAKSQLGQISDEFIAGLSTPRSLSGFNFFNYIYQNLSGFKDAHFKKVDNLGNTIRAFSLSTFGADQPGIFRQIFQKWIDSHHATFDSSLLSFKLVIDNPFSSEAVNTGMTAYSQSLDDAKKNTSDFSGSYDAVLMDFEKVYKNSFPKLGCFWITPGTSSTPELYFSSLPDPDIQISRNISLPLNYSQKLYWMSDHAETCRGLVDAASNDKDWVGPKDFSGFQSILPKKIGIVNYILQCSNSYGASQAVITINVTP